MVVFWYFLLLLVSFHKFLKLTGVRIVFSILYTAVEGNRYPRITVPEGEIEGYYKTAHNGKTFAAFEGIPYAKPPVGELRFQVDIYDYIYMENFDPKDLCY